MNICFRTQDKQPITVDTDLFKDSLYCRDSLVKDLIEDVNISSRIDLDNYTKKQLDYLLLYLRTGTCIYDKSIYDYFGISAPFLYRDEIKPYIELYLEDLWKQQHGIYYPITIKGKRKLLNYLKKHLAVHLITTLGITEKQRKYNATMVGGLSCIREQGYMIIPELCTPESIIEMLNRIAIDYDKIIYHSKRDTYYLSRQFIYTLEELRWIAPKHLLISEILSEYNTLEPNLDLLRIMQRFYPIDWKASDTFTSILAEVRKISNDTSMSSKDIQYDLVLSQDHKGAAINIWVRNNSKYIVEGIDALELILWLGKDIKPRFNNLLISMNTKAYLDLESYRSYQRSST